MPDAQLLRREHVAHGTTAFHFSKPPGFEFIPGQALDLILAPPGDNADDTKHAFSIVSAPCERDLVIATRVGQSPFKLALDALPVGAIVAIDGPFGDLTLGEDSTRPAVLIAGGIGITPFVSMLRQAARARAAPRAAPRLRRDVRPRARRCARAGEPACGRRRDAAAGRCADVACINWHSRFACYRGN